MKINAIIESKDGGTLVLDFPRSIYDVYEKLQSVGIRQSPHQITLSDEDGADVRVKLYSKDEVGKHLLLTLNEQNSLADANMLAFMVDNAKTDFRSKLEQNLLHDQYGSMQEVTDAIKQMLLHIFAHGTKILQGSVRRLRKRQGERTAKTTSFSGSYSIRSIRN